MEMNDNMVLLNCRPVRLTIVYTTKCNINCIMCNRSRKGVTLDASCLEKIKELLPSTKALSWQGGEVFCENGFDSILEYIASRHADIKQDIITNGLLIGKDRARLLVRSNLILSFSIDGVTKETYEYIRKGARFEDLLKSLENICEAEAAYSPITRNMNVVLMKTNYRDLLKYVDFAKKYGFKHIHITPIYGKDIRENIFSENDKKLIESISAAMVEFNSYAKESGLPIFDHVTTACKRVLAPQIETVAKKCINNRIGAAGALYCLHPWKEMFIDISREGNIYPDCFCIKSIGNIYKDNLLDAWNSGDMQEYRNRIMAGSIDGWCNQECVNGLSVPYEHYDYKSLE